MNSRMAFWIGRLTVISSEFIHHAEERETEIVRVTALYICRLSECS